jgi:hypothetical protein
LQVLETQGFVDFIRKQMAVELKKITYSSLNARQKENYNFQKISAVLADYGFVTKRLSDDWNGADFLALCTDGTVLKVQLKPRLTLGKKYQNKDLWVCFPHGNEWYLYKHDELLELLLTDTSIGMSESWTQNGIYSMPTIGKKVASWIEKYRIGSVAP